MAFPKTVFVYGRGQFTNRDDFKRRVGPQSQAKRVSVSRDVVHNKNAENTVAARGNLTTTAIVGRLVYGPRRQPVQCCDSVCASASFGLLTTFFFSAVGRTRTRSRVRCAFVINPFSDFDV